MKTSKTFDYKGKHFTPIRNFTAYERKNNNCVRSLHFRLDKQVINEKEYNHADFIIAAPIGCTEDIFRCEENGCYYVPGAFGLFMCDEDKARGLN